MLPGVIRAGYVPFGSLLPRLAAFVHHGSIGTTSQALRAGVQQLIRPMPFDQFDQFDNSDRAQRLGVALELLPKHYRTEPAIATIDRLMRDRSLRARWLAD